MGVSASFQGVWQYHRGNWLTTENSSSAYNPNSSIWVNFPPAEISETSAFLLHGNDRMRFIPDPSYFWRDGSANIPTLRVKLWDGSLGTTPQLDEVLRMNINTSPFEDTLRSLISPIGRFSDDIMTIQASRVGCNGVVNSALAHDACCVCGGGGDSCVGCDVRVTNARYDSCDRCSGQSTCLGCDYIPFSGTESGPCSECVSNTTIATGDPASLFLYPSSMFQDCSALCYGKALTDNCSVCSGGSTNHAFNSDR